MSYISFGLATGGTQEWWRFADAVGIIIRVRGADGNPLPDDLVRTTQVSNLMVELDLAGRTRLREQASPKRPDTALPGDHSSPGKGLLSAQTQTLVRVLQNNCPSMIHAFALFDADDGNEVGLMEVRSAVAWLYKRIKAEHPDDAQVLKSFDAKAFMRELSSSKLAGRGTTMNLNDFVRTIRFGDTVENWKEKLGAAREWRNALLAEMNFKENNDISALGTGFLNELKARLQEKFENAAEAFVFLDVSCSNVLTETQWRIGLRRLGVDMNVKHLIMVLDGAGGDGSTDEQEFTRLFAWHSLERWDEMMLEAKKNRKATSTRITMELFKENQKKRKLPSLRPASSSVLDKSSFSKSLDSSLVVGNRSYSARGKRGAAQWQGEFMTQVAALVEPPANPDRFMFVGFQGCDIVLGIMPDSSDWKRTPQILATEVQTALQKPGNPLQEWDPSVEGASKTFLLKTHKWNFTTWATRGLFDETMRNNLLVEPFAAKRDHVKFPRSDVGFKTLGSLDHWRCIDGIGKVGAVKDRFELSLLHHNGNGTLLELMHFSPGFFCFRAKAGGPVLCCTEDGRIRERSDLSRKGDGKGPLWKFHSRSTVAQFVEEQKEGQDLKERFAQLTSSVPGRWMVAISVPHVFIQNNSDTALQIVLTPEGFVVLGGGADPMGLIVENNEVRPTSVQAAIDYVRHRPAKPNDLTELDTLKIKQKNDRLAYLQNLRGGRESQDSPQISEASPEDSGGVHAHTSQADDHLNTVLAAERRMLFLDLEGSFERELAIQRSYEDMVLRDGLRDCCSLLKRLHELLSLGEILEPSDRINRRAQLIRVCGDHGKEWVPGTGATTHLAFLVDEVREKVKRYPNVVFVHFFRMDYHSPHEVIAHLMKQLSVGVPGFEGGLNKTILEALGSCSHERMAQLLQELCMHHVLQDKPVIIVCDSLHLSEQRVLGHLLYGLRKALQPWFYPLKRQGYVRAVYSGRDGYSVPSGVSITTLQLHRLSETMARRMLVQMLRVRKKHVASVLVNELLRKKDACRPQYLRVAVSVVQRYWVFEQINGYVEALPEILSDLYHHSIRNLEHDFGDQLVEKVLVYLLETEPRYPPTFENVAKQFSSHADSAKVSNLLEALRELLRIAPIATQIVLPQGELREAIGKRYDGSQEHKRAEERRKQEHAAELRKSQREKCVATVSEKHADSTNSKDLTGCNSLHQAVDAAAAGDEIFIVKKFVHLKHGLEVDRELTISANEGTLVDIGYGQTLLQVGNDELHRTEPQDRFIVTVSGVKMRQEGFEAAEVPYCVRVSANAELRLKNCEVTSDRATGILVCDGAVEFLESKTVLCGGNGMVIQEGGTVELINSKIISNWLHDISDAEQELHEMYIAFCKGETASMYRRRLEVEHAPDKPKINLAGLGKRGTTLSFPEFMEVLKFLDVYPAHITKTEAVNIFKEANQTAHADEDQNEMDWIEFKGVLLAVCRIVNRDNVMGVSLEDLIPKASDREEGWKSSNGIIVRGSKSKLRVRDSEFLNCVAGCIVKKGASAEIYKSKFVCCGRERTDSAGLVSSGRGSLAICDACEFVESEHHGVKAEREGQIQLKGCHISKVHHQGVLAVGRNSRVSLDECEVVSAGICGLFANQRAIIQVANSRITKCSEAGICSSFLGTKIEVQGGVVLEGNGLKHSETRGIVAEYEGTVYVSGQNDFKDGLLAHRQGHIEEPARRLRASSPDHTVSESTRAPDAAVPNSELALQETNAQGLNAEATTVGSPSKLTTKVTRKLNSKYRKPQAEFVMTELSKVFDNAAEAFVMLDINQGGGVSMLELDRGLKRLGIEGVDFTALGKELQMKSGMELDADAFIHNFMWHGLEVFPDESWQMAYVEASRQRRRIMKRFYDRSGIAHEDDSVLGSDWKSKFIDDEMQKRVKVQIQFQKKLMESIKKGDFRDTREKGVQYIKGGNVYQSKAKLVEGETRYKFKAKFGLPGTVSKHVDSAGLLRADSKVDCWSTLIPSSSTRSLSASLSASLLSSQASFGSFDAGISAVKATPTKSGAKDSTGIKRLSPLSTFKSYKDITGLQFPRTENPMFAQAD